MKKIFAPKLWSIWDIACIKWSSIFFGIGFGAYFHEFFEKYYGVLIILVLLLAIRPVLKIFRG